MVSHRTLPTVRINHPATSNSRRGYAVVYRIGRMVLFVHFRQRRFFWIQLLLDRQKRKRLCSIFHL